MAHLLDIPNEILLMVAARLDDRGRRIFSKTCSRIFHLIRGQRDKRKFGIQGNPYSIKIQHVNSQAYLLRIGKADYGSYDIEKHNSNERFDDIRAFAILHENFTYTPEAYAILDECSLPRDRITCIRSTDIHEEIVEMMTEGPEHYWIIQLIYETPFAWFNWALAEKMLRVINVKTRSPACFFIFLNDGFYSETVHDIMDTILQKFLALADTKETVAKELCRALSLREKFTRKCCPPVAAEQEKIDASGRRLLRRLQEHKMFADGEPPEFEAIGAKTCRMFEVFWQGEMSGYLDCENRFDPSKRKPCLFFYKQLPAAEGAALYQQELARLKNEIQQTEMLWRQQHKWIIHHQPYMNHGSKEQQDHNQDALRKATEILKQTELKLVRVRQDALLLQQQHAQ